MRLLLTKKGQRADVPCAFTVLELLVTVAILATLASLILPVLSKAKADANRVTCTNNLRQLGQALIIYASENGDFLPYPDESQGQRCCWFHAIDPYVLRVNPAASGRNQSLVKQDPIWTGINVGTATTIKMNRKLLLPSGADPTNALAASDRIRLAAVAEPSKTVLLFDGRSYDVWPGDSGGSSRFDGWEVYAALRHRMKANVLFVDGHVELRSETLRSDGKHGWENNQTGLIWYGK